MGKDPCEPSILLYPIRETMYVSWGGGAEDLQGDPSKEELGWDPLRPKGTPREAGPMEMQSSRGLMVRKDASAMGFKRCRVVPNNQRTINTVLVL